MWGAAWRKRTGFLAFDLDLGQLELHLCQGPNKRQGICVRTSKPHLQLRGTNSAGVFKTRVAQAYPKKLCREVAVAVYNSICAKRGEAMHNLVMRPQARELRMLADLGHLRRSLLAEEDSCQESRAGSLLQRTIKTFGSSLS
eukprot:3357165-Karenia_brevis.AAC.1